MRSQGERSAAAMLAETQRVTVERRETYGPCQEHFARTVGAINAIFASKLREPLTPADWGLMMILDKSARHQGPNRSDDTLVDIAGYAGLVFELDSPEGGA